MFFFFWGISKDTVSTNKNTPCQCVKRVRRTCVSVLSVCGGGHMTCLSVSCDSRPVIPPCGGTRNGLSVIVGVNVSKQYRTITNNNIRVHNKLGMGITGSRVLDPEHPGSRFLDPADPGSRIWDASDPGSRNLDPTDPGSRILDVADLDPRFTPGHPGQFCSPPEV